MQALLQDNIPIYEAYRIEFGIYDEPDIQKWALFDIDENLMYYVLGEFEKVELNEYTRPSDYVLGKYFYINGEWIENPDYVEVVPTIPLAEQVQIQGEAIAELEEENEDMALCLADMMMDICNLQLGI